jgi:hypothetical protein
MQINKVKNEKGNMTTEVEEIKKKKKTSDLTTKAFIQQY